MEVEVIGREELLASIVLWDKKTKTTTTTTPPHIGFTQKKKIQYL